MGLFHIKRIMKTFAREKNVTTFRIHFEEAVSAARCAENYLGTHIKPRTNTDAVIAKKYFSYKSIALKLRMFDIKLPMATSNVKAQHVSAQISYRI